MNGLDSQLNPLGPTWETTGFLSLMIAIFVYKWYSYWLYEKYLVEISSYLLLVSIGYSGLSMHLFKRMHQIEFSHFAYQGGLVPLTAYRRRVCICIMYIICILYIYMCVYILDMLSHIVRDPT